MSAFDAEYEPSPWEPIAEEVARYERTGGDAPSDPAKFKVNLDRMMESCDAFIERGTIDVIPAGQYAF